MSEESFEDVLLFWFPERLISNHAAIVSQFEWWFRGGADSAIIQRFTGMLERAARGELDHWSDSPRSRLALIVVLDQFSRSVYRGTARAFAQDPKALALTLEGIKIGHYAALETPWEKLLLLALWGTPRSSRTSRRRSGLQRNWRRRFLEHSASQACSHRDVIARFGRHPHRNAILGRPSTPEELEHLASGQLVHTRPLPR